MVVNLRNIPGHDAPASDESLLAFIERNQGNVSKDTALRFANHVSYNGDDPQAISEAQIAALSTETKINLYRIIANYKRGQEIDRAFVGNRGGEPPLLGCLNKLNRQMGLTEEFYQRQTRSHEAFTAPGNTAWLENRWKESGLKTAFGGKSFAQARLWARTANPSLANPRTQALARFTLASYAEFTGRPCPQIRFEDKQNPGLCGYQQQLRNGQSLIVMNTGAQPFQGSYQKIEDTLFHEDRHGQQEILAGKFAAGKISQDHPDYTAAAVFHANLHTDRGYLRSHENYAAYRDQIAEVDARYAGKRATELLDQTYGAPKPAPAPKPVSPLAGLFEEKAGNRVVYAPFITGGRLVPIFLAGTQDGSRIAPLRPFSFGLSAAA